MSKEDNKNYGSVTIVSIATLLIAGITIYLLVNIYHSTGLGYLILIMYLN